MKKIVLLLLILAVSSIGWYLFIKSYDYQFRFKTQSGPAAASREILNWSKYQSDSLIGDTEFNENDFINFSREQKINGANVILDWHFEYINDSLTQILVNSRKIENNLSSRLEILNPFRESDYINDLKQELQSLNGQLDLLQSTYRIELAGISNFTELKCICTLSENIPVRKKAFEMIDKIDVIDSYFVDNKLVLSGYPFLKVTEWDILKGVISFEFCFPTDRVSRISETSSVKIRKFPAGKGLTAAFYGNYRQSHLTWYELLAKAQREKISVIPRPLEIFHNNPRMGENVDKWKAEVYLPLDE